MTGKQGAVTVVVGGQFGSEAKGHITAKLVQSYPEQSLVVRVGGPNAGHSAVGILDGKLWSMRQIPIAAVTRLDCQLLIGAGSEIDPAVLEHEIAQLDAAGYGVSDRLMIDGTATVLDEHHKTVEQADIVERVGSTGKGVGGARSARIMRDAQMWSDGDDLYTVEHSALVMRRWLTQGKRVVIEGTQGYGLGLHAGYYPQCTSSDCRAIDFLSMAGLSPWAPEVASLSVWVVLRTYPIRVAGNSGPLTGEHTWDEMRLLTGIHDLQPELTTVTKKQRRIGQFDWPLAKRAIIENGSAVNIAVTFMDYVDPQIVETGILSNNGANWLSKAQSMLGAPIGMISWAPDKACNVHVDSLTGSVEMSAVVMHELNNTAGV
jgi:adenylosuccinate synthase